MNPPESGCAPAPSTNLTAFIDRELRLPRLGDSVPPWHYRGWQLPYVIRIHELCPATANRWGYHLRTLQAGNLPDEPIPQITFGHPDQHVYSLLHDCSGMIGRDCGGWSDFRTLVDWLCFALSVSKEQPPLDDDINEKLYRKFNVGPLLQAPYDYLGAYVAQARANGWNPTGFYATPHNVVECMVRIMMHDVHAEGRDPRMRSVCDPCAGSGRMLLHASNLSLNLWGQDIDPLAVAMCRINGALYAPWLSFPLPAVILGASTGPSESSRRLKNAAPGDSSALCVGSAQPPSVTRRLTEKNMKHRLSDRELATVLAALRYWQRDLVANSKRGEGPMSMEHFGGDITPLTPEEIDKLCERLNG